MNGGLLDEYREEVERIFGEDLVSLFLYGSHASDDPAPGKEISLLVVVRTLREEALENFRRIAHRYARRGIPAPPLVTETFFRGSADVFPLEYLGLAERRKVLSGNDIAADLTFSAKNLGHQIEFELKGKLLSLGRMYLATSRKREISRLILSTVGPIVAVSRGLLLAGAPRAPHRKEEVLDGLEKRFEVRLPFLREAVDARKAGKLAPARAEEIFFEYMHEVERLASLPDRLPPANTP
ncbi:MAG: hypothetical protein ACXWWV_06010 [Candidatus Deferrimicrobiaceae bacterium]